MTARKLKAPEAQPDVLLADLQHCRYTTPSLALRMAQSPRPISSLPSGLKVSHKQEARSVAVSHSYSSSLLGPHLVWSPPTGVTTPHLPPLKWVPGLCAVYSRSQRSDWV